MNKRYFPALEKALPNNRRLASDIYHCRHLGATAHMTIKMLNEEEFDRLIHVFSDHLTMTKLLLQIRFRSYRYSNINLTTTDPLTHYHVYRALEVENYHAIVIDFRKLRDNDMLNWSEWPELDGCVAYRPVTQLSRALIFLDDTLAVRAKLMLADYLADE